MVSRADFGRGDYLMLRNVEGVKTPYDTSRKNDLDISLVAAGVMGNFCVEGIDSLYGAIRDVESEGGHLLISDMFRDWMMQWQAHQDYITGKKKAFSPDPGKSFHCAGRSIDIDLQSIRKSMDFNLFWEIMRSHGFSGVRNNRHTPSPNETEAWHYDFLGSFDALYRKQRYSVAAQVATMDAIGDNYPDVDHQIVKNFRIQAYLLDLGLYEGKVDGMYGRQTHVAYMGYLAGKADKSKYLDMVLDHYGMNKA